VIVRFQALGKQLGGAGKWVACTLAQGVLKTYALAVLVELIGDQFELVVLEVLAALVADEAIKVLGC